ncbi:MAG TPA: hypothetical protein VFM12_04890 [Gemmatimonadales bacterium]|nr:hypothetical protein [Gemmatimonadales bacterium]
MSAVAAVTMLIGPTYAAESAPTQVDRSPVDQETCRMIIAGLQGAAASGEYEETYTPELKAQIAQLTPGDCYREALATESAAAPLGVGTAAAATSCGYRYKQMGLYSGPIEIATAHYDAYWCWNSSTVWWKDYKNCYVTSFPGFFGDDEYCGVINNNTSLATGRMDFYVAAYSAPWWHRYGWMSFTINRFGTTSGVSGFCCS